MTDMEMEVQAMFSRVFSRVDMEMEVQTMFRRVFNRVIRAIKNYNMALDRRNTSTRITTLDKHNMSTRITSLDGCNMSIRIFSVGSMDSLNSLDRCSMGMDSLDSLDTCSNSATIFNLDKCKMEIRKWGRLIRSRLIKLVRTFVTRCIKGTRVQDGFSRLIRTFTTSSDRCSS